MTLILSWNIQNGKGTDGVISLERIEGVINAMGDPDVICLQEISRNLQLEEGHSAPDQIAEISDLFPDYVTIFGDAVEAGQDGAADRWQFGNATLSRLPILSVFRHPLLQPAEGGIRHMPRQATEVTVATPNGPLRVINTHLEYHSDKQRLAQVRRLRALHEEAVSNAQNPPDHDPIGPYQEIVRPEDRVLCGDFNMETDFDEYSAMLEPENGGTAPFRDAWLSAHPGKPHDPTCGIHDHDQWPQGPHCRDFFFVTDAVEQSVRDVAVDMKTNASDHQPLMLHLID